MKQDLTLDDFFTGLLAALADRGIGVLALRDEHFYKAILDSYQILDGLAGSYHVDCRFAIYLDPIYGDSSVVREAVSGVVMKNLAVLESSDRHDLRIRVDRDQAENLLTRLPGKPALYEKLASVFLRSYPYVAV